MLESFPTPHWHPESPLPDTDSEGEIKPYDREVELNLLLSCPDSMCQDQPNFLFED